MASKYSVKDNPSLDTLDKHLSEKVFVNGNNPGAEDGLVFHQFQEVKTEPDQARHPYVWAWFALVSMYNPLVVEQWRKPQEKEAPKENKGKKDEKKSEQKKEVVKAETPAANVGDDDLFGDDP
jgi:hypothetical protein